MLLKHYYNKPVVGFLSQVLKTLLKVNLLIVSRQNVVFYSVNANSSSFTADLLRLTPAGFHSLFFIAHTNSTSDGRENGFVGHPHRRPTFLVSPADSHGSGQRRLQLTAAWVRERRPPDGAAVAGLPAEAPSLPTPRPSTLSHLMA